MDPVLAREAFLALAPFASADDAYWASDEAGADWAAEIAAEGGWLRAAEAGDYAGSEEEARDRFLDSLVGR